MYLYLLKNNITLFNYPFWYLSRLVLSKTDHNWHKGLIHKAFQVGTPIHQVKFIASFLKDRSFKARVENVLFTSRHILIGVPQRYCVSQLMYLIYINFSPVTSKIIHRTIRR